MYAATGGQHEMAGRHHWPPAGDDPGVISECTALAKMSGGHYLPNRATEPQKPLCQSKIPDFFAAK